MKVITLMKDWEQTGDLQQSPPSEVTMMTTGIEWNNRGHTIITLSPLPTDHIYTEIIFTCKFTTQYWKTKVQWVSWAAGHCLSWEHWEHVSTAFSIITTASSVSITITSRVPISSSFFTVQTLIICTISGCWHRHWPGWCWWLLSSTATAIISCMCSYTTSITAIVSYFTDYI